MSRNTRRDPVRKPSAKRAGRRSTFGPQQTVAREAELREKADHECLGGMDLEHCQRMRG